MEITYTAADLAETDRLEIAFHQNAVTKLKRAGAPQETVNVHWRNIRLIRDRGN